MAFCKYCGKEIPEGSVCSCPEAQKDAGVQAASTENASVNQSAPAPAAAPTPNPNPAPAPNPVPDFSGTAAANDESKKKSLTNLIIAGGGIVVILLLVLIISTVAGGRYKKPVKDFFKGMNKADSERVVNAMFTEDMLDDADEDIDDMYDEFDDSLDDMLDGLEDEFGDDIKIKFSVDEKKSIKDKKLETYEDFYDDYLDADVKIKKGYKLSLTVKIEGDEDDDENDDIEVVVVKIKGEGWKIYPFDGDLMNSFDLY